MNRKTLKFVVGRSAITLRFRKRGTGAVLAASLLLPVLSPAFGQISRGGRPLGSLRATEIEWLDLGRVSADRFLLEDEWTAITGRKSLRVSRELPLTLRPETNGTWEDLPDGTLVWRAGIRGKGARALGLVFGRYALEPGTRVFIYDPSGEVVLGAYTDLNNKPSGSLSVSYLKGDELIIQLEVPQGTRSYGELQVSSVRWAYLPVIGSPDYSGRSVYRSGSCNVDINCPIGKDWQLVKHAVVWLDAAENCTGVLINNTRQDGKAYVLTAAHCVFYPNPPMPLTQRKFQSPIVYFNYENSACGGSDAPKSQSISGATLLATGDTLENSRDTDSLDFALLELSLPPPEEFKPYFAGWNRSSVPPLNTTTIHHPNNDAKKISVDLDPPDIGYDDNYYPEYIRDSFWWIKEWDTAATENGSSGCPLFNQDYLLVGTLTGGDASCLYPTNDYFTRFDYAWDHYPEPDRQLKHWLDPDNTGVMSLQGMDGIPKKTGRVPEPAKLCLYPNPVAGVLRVSAGLKAGQPAEIGIYDVSGKAVRREIRVWEGDLRIDVQDLAEGFYIFTLKQGENSTCGTFIRGR